MALLHCNFYSQVLRVAASMDVILPERACLAGARVPVLYLLHGLSDDHTIWQRRTSIERYAEARQIAVVMPAVGRSFYTDMAAGPAYWTYVSEEIPALASALFPLSDQRRDCCVAGLSMGGYGALKLGLRCPGRFAAAATPGPGAGTPVNCAASRCCRLFAAGTNHGTHSLHKLSQLGRRERAGRPQDDRLMNGDESVGKSNARPIDATA